VRLKVTYARVVSATPPPPSTPSEPETTPEEYRQRALLLADLGRYDEAAGEIASGLDTAPSDAALLATLARIHLAADQPAEALVAADRAVAAAPDTINPLVVRAMALSDSRRFADAARVATGILHRWPGDPYAQRTGAALLSEARNGQEALNAAWHGVRVAPDEAEAHLVLAVVAARLRLFDLAQRAYGEALDLDEAIGDAQTDIGIVRLERRRWAQALEDLADEATLEPPPPPPPPPLPPSPTPPADAPYPSPFPRPYRTPDAPDAAAVDDPDEDSAPGSSPADRRTPRRPSGPSSRRGFFGGTRASRDHQAPDGASTSDGTPSDSAFTSDGVPADSAPTSDGVPADSAPASDGAPSDSALTSGSAPTSDGVPSDGGSASRTVRPSGSSPAGDSTGGFADGRGRFEPPAISRPSGPVLDPSEDSADAVRRAVRYGASGTLVAAVLTGGMTVASHGASRVWAGMIGALILAAVLIWLSRLPEPLATALARLRTTDRRLAIAAYATFAAPSAVLAYAVIGGLIPLVAAMIIAATAELLVLTRRPRRG